MSTDLNQLSPSRFFLQWLPFFAVIALLVHHFWFLWVHAFNIPYQDDIYDFLLYLNLAEAADGSLEAFSEWFRNYNDHRTSASRLIVLGAHLVTGEVNFRTLVFLANLALPFILLLFYWRVRKEKFSGLMLLSAALLLLHLRTFNVTLWAQAALAYYFVFFYAFACLFALHKVTASSFVLAIILCTLSSLTYASGQLVWLLGLASLLHQSVIIRRKSLLYPIVWLLISVVMLIVWRIGFVVNAPSSEAISMPEGLSFLPEEMIDAPLHVILARYASFFLVLLGSAFTDSSTQVAGAVGAGMVSVLIFVSLRFLRHEDNRLVLCCWFIVATAAAVTVGRAFWLRPEYIFASTRYTFLSVLLVCTLTLLVQIRYASARATVLCLVAVLASCYWSWTFRHFSEPLQTLLEYRKKQFNADRYHMVTKPLSESKAIVSEAVARGIYNPPCRPFSGCQDSIPPAQ